MVAQNCLAEMWCFPWPSMDVLIGGKSSIDLPELQVATFAEASEFLKAYGFDADKPSDRRYLHAVLVEAVAFIEHQLIQPHEWRRGVRPPDDILFCVDPRHLLVWASSSDRGQRWRSAWACAILRVMHTIGHLEGVNRSVDLDAARSQIFDRFRAHIWEEGESLWFGGAECKVELTQVGWKEKKGRNSIILKLLHKRDNVAETIYDYVGIRLVTKDLGDAMLAVKILNQYHILCFPNAYPARARNTLVDTAAFRSQVDGLTAGLAAGTLSPADFQAQVATLAVAQPAAPVSTNNLHSAASYKAIQLTGRQLIRVPYHRFDWFVKLTAAVGTKTLEPKTMAMLRELRTLVEGWHSVKDSLEDAAFFPFEVQILDAENYDKSQHGEANHDRYKQSQVKAARKRVLGRVLECFKTDTPNSIDIP